MQLVLWTAGVVVLTLIVNAPIIPPLVGRLGLLDVAPVKRRMRAKAARALLRFSRHAVHDLQQDPDEMLRGLSTVTAFRLHAREARMYMHMSLIVHTAMGFNFACPMASIACWMSQVVKIARDAGVDWREVEKQIDLHQVLAHILTQAEDPLHRKRSHSHEHGRYAGSHQITLCMRAAHACMHVSSQSNPTNVCEAEVLVWLLLAVSWASSASPPFRAWSRE